MRRQRALAATAVLLVACARPASDGSTDAAIEAGAAATSDDAVAAPAQVDAGQALPAAQAFTPTTQGSTIAGAPGGRALLVVDEVMGVLRRLPLPLTDAVVPGGDDARVPITATDIVPLPGPPAEVLSQADRVLVTVRNPGLLVILRAADLVETARVPLPADAWGLAVSPDGATAVVTSAWTHQVSSIDLTSGQKRWSVDVAREPRGVVVRADGAAAYVSHLTSAALTRIDGVADAAPKVKRLPLPPAPLRTTEALPASLGYALTLSPDGTRVFAPRHANGAIGEAAWFGAGTVDVLLTRDDTPLVARRAAAPKVLRRPGDYPEHPLVDGDAGAFAFADLTPFAQPRAVVTTSEGTVLVVSEGTSALVEFPADSLAPALERGRVTSLPCHAPSGVALGVVGRADEEPAYVACRAPDAVVACNLSGGHCSLVRLADDPLPEPAANGRALFYDASDQDISGGMGCAGCHPEGRDDGQVWHEVEPPPASRFTSLGSVEERVFVGSARTAGMPGFARQTPILAGRVSDPGPYGWHAENPDLESRIHEGMHLHRWISAGSVPAKTDAAARALVAFIRTGLAAPPREARPLTAIEERGRAVFLSDETRCATCHDPRREYTDRAPHVIAPWPPAPGFDTEEGVGFKPPSLLFVSGSPPYYHDGSVLTLEDLVAKNNDRMGKTRQLSAADRAALVAFLGTL